MKYQFFDNDGKVTESEQKSYTDALKFAEERGITCLSMPYELFIASFREKSNCWKATPSIVRFRNMQKNDYLEPGCRISGHSCE